MPFSRRTFLNTSAAAAAFGTTQLLGLDRGNAQNRAQVLNLYSSRHYNTDRALYDDFTKQTGIRINLVEGKEDELIQRLKSEGRNSPADIFITVDAGRLWRLTEDKLFVPAVSRVLTSRIPANFRDPQNRWFAFSSRARVIMYNRDKVNPSQLSTYEDLANPKWRGKVLVRSSSNIYNISLVSGLIQRLGAKTTEDWCRGLVANFARQPEGNDTAQITALSSGRGEVALVNTYYLPRLAASKNPQEREAAQKVGVFFPNQGTSGTHTNVSGGGVMATSKNKAAAVRFLEYLASNSAQGHFARGNNEYPVVPGVPLDPILASYGTFKPETLNVSAYGRNSSIAVRVMDRADWK
jgi:iron(III) transport system substrate-binding protein